MWNQSSDMDSCEVKSEESCDFFQEFMDLEEFIDASMSSASSPTGSIQSTSCQIPDAQTCMSVNEQQSLQEQQMVNNSAIGVGNYLLNSSCQIRNLTSLTSESNTEDEQNASVIPDCDSSLGNGVVKDRRYWDRRIKNNIAAKRSRDAKRLKETTVVKRWTFLEEENKHLKEQIKNMKRRLNAANGGDTKLPIN